VISEGERFGRRQCGRMGWAASTIISTDALGGPSTEELGIYL